MNFDWSQFDEKWAAGLIIVGALMFLLGGFTNIPMGFSRGRDDGFQDDEYFVLSRRGAMLFGGLAVVAGLVLFAVRSA